MMSNIEDGKLYWMVRDSDGSPEVLGFIKNHMYGAAVIGGPTGTHCTGHGENWLSKWEEIQGQGFVEQSDAIAQGLVPDDWKPPRVSRKDKKLIETFVSY